MKSQMVAMVKVGKWSELDNLSLDENPILMFSFTVISMLTFCLLFPVLYLLDFASVQTGE